MRPISRFLPVILLMLAAAGCQSAGRLGPSGLPKGAIAHVVVMWLTDRGDEFAKQEIISAGQKLEHIPGVTSVVAGRVLSSDRPKVDGSYDLTFIMTFSDESALRHFTENADQVAIMANVLRYTRDVKVYDVVAE